MKPVFVLCRFCWTFCSETWHYYTDFYSYWQATFSM